MELKHIKELMAAMGRTGTKKLSLKQGEFELTLERGEAESWKPMAEHPLGFSDEMRQAHYENKADQALSKGSELPPRLQPETSKEDTASSFITSPMVGTFYVAPSPEDPPFIKVGDKVEKNQVVCIIEAMKVMNEIKAGLSGTISEVLVDSGQPVEFGTKLFRIIP